MPVRKKLSHRALIDRLLSSDKLGDAERRAFEVMAEMVRTGGELTGSQKLWIETLRPRLDA